MLTCVLRSVAVVAGLVSLLLVVVPGPARAQSSTASITWNTWLGGNAADGGFSATDDWPEGVITNKLGETFVTGRTNAPGFPGGLSSPSPMGGTDAFVARLELDGTVSWLMYLGSASDDEGRDVHIYENLGYKALIVVGKQAGEVFVTQLDEFVDGPDILWSTTFGSPGDDVAYGVTHNFDRLLVGGSVSQTVSTTSLPKVLNNFSGGGSDGFVAQLNADGGTVNWFEYLGGDGPDDVRDVVKQPTGGVVVIGNSHSTNFPPVAPRPNGQKIFLLKVNDDGSLDPKKLLIGNDGEFMEGHAATDADDNIYVGGRTPSANLALNAFDPTFEPGTYGDDGFVAMVDWNLRPIWTSYVGGPTDASEAVMGLSAVPRGQLTFVGHSNASTGVLVVDKGYERSPKGGMDGFVFRARPDGGTPGPDSGTPGPDSGTPGPDAGTPGSDGGTPGPGDAGTGPSDEEVLSPLGWSCGSTGGGGSAGVIALMVLALALALRRGAGKA